MFNVPYYIMLTFTCKFSPLSAGRLSSSSPDKKTTPIQIYLSYEFKKLSLILEAFWMLVRVKRLKVNLFGLFFPQNH